MQTSQTSKVRGATVRLNRRAIPNVSVLAHDGSVHRFYEDLVRDQLVLIAFMSIEHDAHYPCTPRLRRIRDLLDLDPDNRVQLLSVTVDPEHDTPRRLSEYAALNGANAGRTPWRFLTAAPEDIDLVRASLYVHRSLAPEDGTRKLYERENILALPHHKAVMDCSMGLMRYGNESLDIWGGAPVKASAEDVVARLSWLRGDVRQASSSTKRRRGGPFRVSG
ncbi:SCO family protein [Granulosicoccus antarcticus]|uniref:Thioredoxin domain-containing protein n=1 Tax=Granulosicoccus antarcticus IMCC3135 TaxID=1192854 RepID=A0A2Z2NSB6_9GAMM|nr:SCO family protein [Granulosicoccus antarcticus]ASJ72901.1 hypothetical protein IMCC3135_14080 [Granulosicoccus antarcticus IMCC3135]